MLLWAYLSKSLKYHPAMLTAPDNITKPFVLSERFQSALKNEVLLP
ncbi:hypothetical protein [Candidatus Enterovibrio altilux]|nr:hypothetical protein [Candidatus Enterovibrio luxaltus]